MPFHVTVEFVRGVAELSSSDGLQSEWPPHPARLYQAFVASADLASQDQRSSLLWLEQLSPPSIRIPEWNHGASRENYVPTNELRDSRKPGWYQQHPGRVAKGWRRWPRIVVGGRITYIWDATPSHDVAESLDRIAKAIPFLGRSTSPVVISTQTSLDIAAGELWQPEDRADSTPMRVCRVGYLDALERAYDAEQNAHEVPTRIVTYAPAQELPLAMFDSPYEPAMYIAKFTHPIDVRHLAATCRSARHKVATEVRKFIPAEEQSAALCGHANRGETSWHQMLFLGLPFVDSEHATGLVHGLAVAIPKELDRQERRVFIQALHQLKEVPLGKRKLWLEMPGSNPPQVLTSSRWSKPATIWASATPFVPDRYCRNDAERTEAVERAIKHAGLPPARYIATFKQPVIDGASYLGAHSARRKDSDLPRPSFHAIVEFDQQVRGPIALGNMRTNGLGLMLPEPATAPTDLAS